jgi:hypothetical protein
MTQTKDERRADALERALREVQALIPDRHDPDYDRDVRSLEGVLDSVVKVVNTALYTPSDQPAQDDYPTGPPDSLPAGGYARRLRPTADQPADAGEPEHRASLAVVPDGYYGWNVTKDSRIVSGPHRSQADAVEAMRAHARRSGDTP